MARSVSVNWSSSKYVVGRDDGIRIRITLTANTNVPAELFAYRIVPNGVDTTAYFSHVCSPSDIEDFPANTASPEAVPPWFRLSYVDVLLRSTEEAENFRTVVLDDIRRLIATLDRMAVLFPTGSTTIST